uniref:Cyclin C-terminal domain-containing protein n=1 Tax=Oryza barthii TaxID=65489 RepID=A0A0D3H0C4_9ORYZ
MGAPAAGGGDDDRDVVFEYLLCTEEDAASAGSSFQQLQGLAPAVSLSPYMDRFLSLHRLPGNGWAMQLLAVTCLSLAAKMEETLIDTRYIFEPRTIFRMELLVLDALDWRLRSITPFTFMYLFAFKVDPNGKHIRELIHQATQVTLATIHDTEFLDHCPSSIAAAAVLCASSEIMQLVSIDHGTLVSWRIIGLDEEAIIRCYRLMQQLISSNNVGRESTEITMAATTTTATTAVSSEEVVSSSPPSKRRKMSPGT